MRIITIASVTMSLLFAGTTAGSQAQTHTSKSSAHSSTQTICERAYGVRKSVVHRFSSGAGVDFCTLASTSSHRPSSHARAVYLRQLEVLNHEPHWFSMDERAGGPPQWPAGVRSQVILKPVGRAACIISKESLTSGLDRADNGSHFGVGQWDIPTWLSQGGGRYGESPLDATLQEQYRVLSEGIEEDGCSAWCPYEPGPSC